MTDLPYRSECKCQCHSNGMLHIKPCCRPDDPDKSFPCCGYCFKPKQHVIWAGSDWAGSSFEKCYSCGADETIFLVKFKPNAIRAEEPSQ